MKNKQEEKLYRSLGKIIIDSLVDQEMDKKWEKAILKVGYTHGIINYKTECIWKGEKRSLWGVSDPGLLSSTIKELHQFTHENDYAPWNEFIFELGQDYEFNINYYWSQELNDKYDELE